MCAINQPVSSVNTHPHGQPYVLPAGAFFEIRDCKVARTTSYYNLPHWIEAVSRWGLCQRHGLVGANLGWPNADQVRPLPGHAPATAPQHASRQTRCYDQLTT